ncbi:MAG: hypothetical protein WD716_00625 [Fimbriimonadaceae bacterium]
MNHSRLVSITGFLLIAVVAPAQVAQCLFPYVTSNNIVYTWVGTEPTIYFRDSVEGTNRLEYGMWVAGEYQSTLNGHQYYSASQTFYGGVRVAWIGEKEPDPTVSYSAKFHVWGIRTVKGWIYLQKPNPPRTMLLDAVITGTHVELPSSLHLFKSTPPAGLVWDRIGLEPLLSYGAPTPTLLSPGDWTYLGQVVTGGVFVPDGSGGWYADMNISDGAAHHTDFNGGSGIFSPVDQITSDTVHRVTFELFEVAGEPVIP